jgi:micrococcal nuclease
MYEYRCAVLRVVDGDTVDVDIDLGFGVWLRNERVRVMGIDTPESRTSDDVEKIFGLAAKKRLGEILGETAILRTQKPGKSDEKFGRILGDFVLGDKTAGVILIEEGHAVPYFGDSKDNSQDMHRVNRERLLKEGVVDAEAYEKALIKKSKDT